jgi:penicillin-binding protein 1A
VFGAFPTTEDPKSEVIWEAFQPETEPRRSFRRSEDAAAGDGAAAGANAAPARRATPRAKPKVKVVQDDFLQRQGGIY